MFPFLFSLKFAHDDFCFLSGLDPNRFRNHSTESDDNAFGALESQIPDSIRFKDAAPLIVQCRKCTAQMAFSYIYEREVRFLLQLG